jgi:hypothetical protein
MNAKKPPKTRQEERWDIRIGFARLLCRPD